MPIIQNNCKETGWQQRLKRDLRDRLDVDLLNLNCAYDGDFCRTLAREFSMEFTMMQEHNYGCFRKS